jgi:hypothetical protein
LQDGATTFSPNQSAAFEPILDAYRSSGTIMVIAVVGSVAWAIAMLSAAVAFTVSGRRRLVVVLSLIIFFIVGWARTSLMSADGGTISFAWWLVLIGVALAMFIAGKPRVPAVLLVLAGALFSAAHPMPTGPLGLACFFGAAVYIEVFEREREGLSWRRRVGD